MFSCTDCSAVQNVQLYRLFSCTDCSTVQTVQLYRMFSCTDCLAVQNVQLYRLFSCTECSAPCLLLCDWHCLQEQLYRMNCRDDPQFGWFLSRVWCLLKRYQVGSSSFLQSSSSAFLAISVGFTFFVCEIFA